MRFVSCFLVLALVGLAPGARAQAPGDRLSAARPPLIQAEGSRASTPEQLRLLIATATATSPLQPVAVRALGRLERPALIDTLLPILEADLPAARAETANALVMSVGKDPAAGTRVREALLARLVAERDADVRGAIGEALGRLPLDASANVQQVEKALVDIISIAELTSRVEKQAAGGRIVGLTLTSKKEALVPMPAMIGGLRGLESLARAKARAQQSLLPETVARLRQVLTSDPATTGSAAQAKSRQADAARARRLALLCLLPVNGVDGALVSRALGDGDVQVRRLAVSAGAADRALAERGLKDAAWLVRYEALRTYGRRFQAAEGCAPIVGAVGNQADHVSLLAIDLLANACRPEDKAVEVLVDLAVAGPEPQWHRPAHALVALAKAAPDRARPYVARFVDGGPWQSRMYAARAAAQLADAGIMRRLAGDANDNVREAAIAGLSKTVKHEADAIYVTALAASDFQLVMTAAGALAGTPDRATAVLPLLTALSRLTALDSDPSRDPRVAILERLQELGSSENAEALKPYLNDVDPRVAELAARVVSAWTGVAVAASPRPRAVAVPSFTANDLERLSKTTVRITMASGGQFDVKPMVDLAPVSSASFVERAARGDYTGLTFHRVLPNFLIQGGSPGANEFMGGPRYLVDEPGRESQVRGTVGTSTRGRDTGDGQIYINLVDTPRLDHEYSIFADVVRGMDVVDRILEGDVMQKVEVIVR